LLHLDDYRDFLYTYFERLGWQEYDLDRHSGRKPPFTEFSYALAKKGLKNPSIRSYVLYRIADIHLNEIPIDEIGDLVDDFNQECREEKYLAPINQYYAKLMMLKKGMPAPDFSFPDQNGRTVSLSSFRGNLVYLDIWNAGCSPCFKEFPLFERLKERYRGRNIVFVGVSLDSNQAIWEKAVKVKGAGGLQLFANGWDSPFVRDYLIYSNPRFILIDENGNIISAKAPRPSENVEKLIDQYLRWPTTISSNID
jgi:peroxiredoxin